MSNSAVRFVPTFVLKGIDPKDITEKYFKGKYNEVEIPPYRIKVSDVFHVTTPSYGSSPEEPRYQFKDKNNASIVIVTSNSKNYDLYKRAKHFEEKDRICPYCLRNFYHEPTPVAINIEMQECDNKIYYFFWTTNVSCCSFPCAFAWSHRESYGSHRYKCAYRHLKTLYRLMHPGKRIVEAPDWTLLETNGGPLSEEEYDKGSYKYERTSNIIFLPAKEEYIQVQLS